MTRFEAIAQANARIQAAETTLQVAGAFVQSVATSDGPFPYGVEWLELSWKRGRRGWRIHAHVGRGKPDPNGRPLAECSMEVRLCAVRMALDRLVQFAMHRAAARTSIGRSRR